MALRSVRNLCTVITISVKFYQIIGLVGRVFTNDPVARGSIPGRIMPKI